MPAAAVEETVDENTTDPDIDIDTGTETDIDKDKDIDTDANIADDSDSEEASDPSAKDADKQTADEKDGSVKSAKDTKSEGLVFEGDDYTVTVKDKNSILPEAVHVESEEIRGEDSKQKKAYDEYVTKTEEALGLDEGTVSYARIFDIKIVDGEGNKYDIPEPVDVSIRLADRDSSKGSKGTKKTETASTEDLQVVHFEDGAEEGEVIESVTENEEDGSVVEFEAEGFSVYSIVEAPEPEHFEPYKLNSVEEIEKNTVYRLSYGSPEKYFTSRLNGKGALEENSNQSAAADWYFEKADEDGSTFYIYTIVGSAKKYIHQKTANDNLIELADQGTAFVLSEASDKLGTFIFKHSSEGRYLQHSGSGGGIRFYTDADNQTNARIYITNPNPAGSGNDPYELGGKSFGIAYNDNSTKAAAMSAGGKTVSNQSRLGGIDMLIRADVLTNTGILLVAENSDIQEWTFESVEKDSYRIKTTVDGSEKYLNINSGDVTLVDGPDDASLIQVTPGTGTNKGKWHFTVNGYSLNFSGSAANGFNAANNSNVTTWLNLVEKSTLTEEDFVEYSARKISASDDILSGSAEGKTKVIIYTRVWNDDTRKYEFYAVDHDGSLVRVYESGDHINWVGNKVNSALWEFTEYTNDDGTPNNYYELENTAYTNTFLAPQSSGVIANNTVGVNMEGRQEGFDYTSIIAWDEEAYAYSGLKVEGGKVVSCPRDEADDFYFAVIVPPVEAADPPTTVETVDNNDFGISIKMIDFNNPKIKEGNSERDSVQHPFFGGHQYDQNNPDTELLSTNLTNGYPSTTAKTGNAGHSLSELFTGMTDVNHLFIQSVYNESGYFEYDSTQNFAHLKDDGDFKVYNQIAAIGTSTGDTRTHGQFMPYNDISEVTGYARDTSGNLITNKTDVLRNELPDSDPRKGEPLYKIPQDDADYFFGMELSASFTQTPSGLDNWGHDIIFEFTGDDDFWFYVDDELVLDLGGIHSAMPGSVNFRTGEVIVNKTTTSLYDIFRSHYQERGMSAAEISQKLGEIFMEKEVNGKTVHVFNDYSTHTMKMFYMERGAGASNLKMRFNLASVQPGTVELSKKLTGTDNASNKLIQYPYQIWYKMPVYIQDASGNPVIDHYEDAVPLIQGSTASAEVCVVYKGRKKLVPFSESMDIGGTNYNNVFLLKSGETAVIKLPDPNCQYEIIECGVDTNVYDLVSVNGNTITGALYNNMDTETTATEDVRRKDFGIDYETTGKRPRVEYTNNVSQGAMRTLSFKKVVYDTEGHPMSDEDTAKISARFRFRLSLGNEFADENKLDPANKYSYYVKDPNGKYCRWNSAGQRFDSLDITEFEGDGGLEKYLETASSAEKSAVVFTTSMNGWISNIPAGYTVEVRDLIVGTKYKVDEPDREIPRGYTRRDNNGYVRTDLDKEYVYYTDGGVYGRHPAADNKITAEPIIDTINDKTESPKIEIRNQEGWGLTAKKEWTDKDFMIHDPIYMAVYLKDGQLVNDTVRRLNTGDTEVYWFFDDLKVGDEEESHNFADFIVREVKLSGTPDKPIVVDESTGEVTDYANIEPVNEGDSISVSGRTYSGTERTENYTVNYQTGGSTGQNEKIRTDTVTNSRPGIQIYKTDWNEENYLSGAEFTLKDSGGHDVGHEIYTSDSNGLVTTAYLSEGTFTLDEIKTPFGYAALDKPITINVTTTEPSSYDLIVTSGSTIYYITLSGPEGFYTTTSATESSMACITVKNRTVQELKVVKVGVDGETRPPLSGVHFALYDQVRDSEGNVRPAYNPKTGYDDIVTSSDGVLEDINMSLGTGTYYLREKTAPSGYKKLTEDLCFSIGRGGTVTINNAGYASWLTKDTSVSGKVSYKIEIEDEPLGITIRKTDEEGNLLPGSKFVLCKKNDEGSFVLVTDYGLKEGVIDLSDKAEMTFTGMDNGFYKLSEDDAPPGYVILTKDVFFNVSNGAVTLTDENGVEKTYSDVSLLDNNTTIAVKNTPGTSLPNAGGPGTRLFYIFGIILTAGCAILLIARRRVGAGAGKRS